MRVIQVAKVGIGVTKCAKCDVKEFLIDMICTEILSKMCQNDLWPPKILILVPLAYGSICNAGSTLRMPVGAEQAVKWDSKGL